MKKLLFISILTLSMLHLQPALVSAQGQYVRVSGKTYNAEDSSLVSAHIRFQQLPYGGHTGDFNSSHEGEFVFWLELDSSYQFTLGGVGFDETEETISVVDPDFTGMMERDFFVTPSKEENFSLHNLIFTRASDVIRESSYQELNEFVVWLKERPTMVVQLEGHTDSAGNPEANMRLSQSRVEAVKKYLNKKGIKENRVRTKAFGGTQPLSEERTPEAIRANRRVEVRVVAR